MAGIAFWANRSAASDNEPGGAAGPKFAEDAVMSASSGGEGPGLNVKIGSAWDTVTIGGLRLAGVCDVKGVAAIELEKKKVKGRNGSTLLILGNQPALFEVSVLMWTKEQWEWNQGVINELWILPQREPQKTKTVIGKGADGKKVSVKVRDKTRPGLDVDHPALQSVGISKCIVQAIRLPEPGTEAQTKVVRFSCVEHREPTKRDASKKAKGTKPGRVKEYATGEAPKNSAPALPSADKKNLSPRGQPAAPAGGTH